MRDPYSVLGVSPNSSEEEIKKAYKKLAKQYHPDVTGNSPEAEKKMQEINAAYDEIMNKKNSYNPFESTSYQDSAAEEPLVFQAAQNYIRYRRFSEALNALSQLEQKDRNAKWYYLAAICHANLGNATEATLNARKACSMDPGNQEYSNLLNYLETGRSTYQEQNRSYGRVYSGGLGSFCLSLLMARFCCFFCC